MTDSVTRLDDVDRKILDLLREDARRPIRDIAQRVHLSVAPVSRRIRRLEQSGTIRAYTILTRQPASSLEAFTELTFSGDMDHDEILRIVTELPEVRGAYTTTGGCDALVHLAVDDITQLQLVIGKLRRRGNPVSSRTLVVLKKRTSEAM